MSRQTDHAGMAAPPSRKALLLVLNDRGILREQDVLSAPHKIAAPRKSGVDSEVGGEIHRETSGNLNRVTDDGTSIPKPQG